MTETIASDPSVQAAHFVQHILPTVERHARFAFRWMTNPADREDAIQETIALCWAWSSRLAARGKDAAQFAFTLANFASLHVKAGRKLCGTEDREDVLSPTARRRQGFEVKRLIWQEALSDNAQTPPPDAAAFRIDFPTWLSKLSHGDRGIVELMIAGEGTCSLARTLGVSEGRVSQLRKEYRQCWAEFHGESIQC